MPMAMVANPVAIADKWGCQSASTAPARSVPKTDGRKVTAASHRRRYAVRHSTNIAARPRKMHRDASPFINDALIKGDATRCILRGLTARLVLWLTANRR